MCNTEATPNFAGSPKTCRTKQMSLAIFDSKGLIYSKIVLRGATVNAAYIVKALASFMKNLKQKRPYMAARDW